MKNKKGKSLAMKLIDDLINDEDTLDEKTRPVDKDDIDTDSRTATGPSSESDTSDALVIDDVQSDADETVRLPQAKAKQKTQSAITKPRADETTAKSNPDETTANSEQAAPAPSSQTVRSTVGRAAPMRTGVFASPTEAALATSENLRIAQNRILELEQELERLRVENEQLAAAGETLRRRGDEAASKVTRLEEKVSQTKENAEQEMDLLREGLTEKEKEARQLRNKLEETEARISSNIKKIRVRERELENRLELVKMEGQALIRSKDEIILDLKRQLDQLTIEMDNYRSKGQELNRLLAEKQELTRRTVKALRIALSMLEGDESAPSSKKVKSG